MNPGVHGALDGPRDGAARMPRNRTVVSVVENAHARPRLQEPPGLGIESRLTLGGCPFLKQFLEPLFSSIVASVGSKTVPTWSVMGLYFLIFSQKLISLNLNNTPML